MRVALIGSGNVATILGRIIKNAGHDIVQVLSRNEYNAKILADILECGYGNYLSSRYDEADMYLFAITDNALHHLERHLQLENKLVLHTAGSVSKDVLSSISNRYGVIYPLQSLHKALDYLPEVPLLIDGSSPDITTYLLSFAQTLTNNVTVARDEDRLKFHIAAVFVNNFTNHLYALADDFCQTENIDFSRLFPLIDETAKRLKTHTPKELQTGPARRQDLYTMSKHLKALSGNTDLKYIYLKLSESILKLHQTK